MNLTRSLAIWNIRNIPDPKIIKDGKSRKYSFLAITRKLKNGGKKNQDYN
jgi:hypothetical protein